MKHKKQDEQQSGSVCIILHGHDLNKCLLSSTFNSTLERERESRKAGVDGPREYKGNSGK